MEMSYESSIQYELSAVRPDINDIINDPKKENIEKNGEFIYKDLKGNIYKIVNKKKEYI